MDFYRQTFVFAGWLLIVSDGDAMEKLASAGFVKLAPVFC